MTEVHHFAYGWISPALAYGLSFFGYLFGLVLAARARGSSGPSRARWLTLAAVAIGGLGIWASHFMALLGFDVVETMLRYDATVTALGFGIAIVVTCLGVYLVGFGRPSAWKVIVAGLYTGVGLVMVHWTGVLAMRLSGRVSYDPRLAAIGLGVGVLTATIGLWFVMVIRGGAATVFAAMIMAVSACSTHYLVMSAIRVELTDAGIDGTAGVNPFVLLAPVCLLATLMISGLAYSTVGFSVQPNTAKEEALLARARAMYTAASLLRSQHRGRAGQLVTSRPEKRAQAAVQKTNV